METVLNSHLEKKQFVPATVQYGAVPGAGITSLPHVTDDSLGIIARWKAKKIGEKAALEALTAQYTGHLELLKHNILEQVKVGKGRISLTAEELLKEIDAKHLEVLAQLGLRNVNVRLKTMTALTDLVVARLKEVEAKTEWPVALKEEMINNAFALRDRAVAEIMKDANDAISVQQQTNG